MGLACKLGNTLIVLPLIWAYLENPLQWQELSWVSWEHKEQQWFSEQGGLTFSGR